jgi:hypothetical protein
MKREIETAISELIEAWETPDSPEAFAGAMYQLKRVYRAEMNARPQRKPRRARKISLHNT